MKLFYILRVGCSTILCFVLAIVLVFSIKPLREHAGEAFWTMLGNQLDKEMQERQERRERGEIVPGRDTIFIWGNTYEIWHTHNGKALDIYTNGISDFVLLNVTAHKKVKNKLYIISEDGYAVIDKEDLCRVYITLSDEAFANGYSIDEQGNKKYNSEHLDNPHIKYLSDFSEFSEKEQETLTKLRKSCETDR